VCPPNPPKIRSTMGTIHIRNSPKIELDRASLILILVKRINIKIEEMVIAKKNVE
jgi:hypothetical protein